MPSSRRNPKTERREGLVALTGTPGTGKTSVARALAPRWRSVELGEWAVSVGAGRKIRDGFEVDLERLSRLLRRPEVAAPGPILVGHLAHLLPVHTVVVLRCHPERLRERLDRDERGSAADRKANYVSEAIDLVLLEALRPGRKVYEIDTTDRTVAQVARLVARRLEDGGRSEFGIVDWLSDPVVTEHVMARPE